METSQTVARAINFSKTTNSNIKFKYMASWQENTYYIMASIAAAFENDLINKEEAEALMKKYNIFGDSE